MSDDRGVSRFETIIHSMAGDDTILCVLVAARGKRVAVINTRYPGALAHAEANLSAAFGSVLICTPACAGPHPPLPPP